MINKHLCPNLRHRNTGVDCTIRGTMAGAGPDQTVRVTPSQGHFKNW